MTGAEVELPHRKETVDDDSDNNQWLFYPSVIEEGNERKNGWDRFASVEIHTGNNDEQNVKRDDAHDKPKEQRVVFTTNTITNPNTMMILKYIIE